MCVRGTLFLVRDDEIERDSQLIGHGMTHSIQVRYEYDDRVIIKNRKKIFKLQKNET